MSLPSKATTDVAGKLTFTAQNEVDAVQLAALWLAWTNMPADERIREFRREALTKYCELHKLDVWP